MNLWIQIPNGVFLVTVDSALWTAVKMRLAFRGIPWRERPAPPGETLSPMTFVDFLSTLVMGLSESYPAGLLPEEEEAR